MTCLLMKDFIIKMDIIRYNLLPNPTGLKVRKQKSFVIPSVAKNKIASVSVCMRVCVCMCVLVPHSLLTNILIFI